MNTLLLIIIIILVFGGGGGYYSHRRWGSKGAGMSIGAVLMIILLLYMLGILR